MDEAEGKIANAPKLDKLFGTRFGMSVYENLIGNYSISTDEARLSIIKPKKIASYIKRKPNYFFHFDYPTKKAPEIAVLTTTNKIYFDMCNA